MTDIDKLSTLLDDPEIRDLILGLAAGSGAARLRALVLRLADTTSPEQYLSWLSDDAPNQPMTVGQVRTTVGDDAIDDLARSASGSPAAVAWQLAAVLPDFVDAVTPSGKVIDAGLLAREIGEANAEDDQEAGAFGSYAH